MRCALNTQFGRWYSSMMPVITLDHVNRAQVRALLTDSVWSVACLCAAWCDVCSEFRSSFDVLAAEHPDKVLLWIDIEDEADVVGDFEVENFPTLLIARGDQVAFYGAIEGDVGSLHRLVTAQTRHPPSRGTDPAGSHETGPDLRASLGAAS